tara:strand:+ start:378 stop:3335 length:2958 start_codon:yes stop_codon:yes gene_type:complete
MGCKTNGGYRFGVCSGFGPNLSHCYYYTPPGGVTLEFKEFPQAIIRKESGYNLPEREDNRVMYTGSTAQYNSTAGGSSSGATAICGKATKADNCSTSFRRNSYDTNVIAFDFTPSELSFDFMYSDTWFSYLYDTSSEAGHVGTAAYHIERAARGVTSTTPASGTPGSPGYNAGGSSTVNDDGDRCIPCAAFTCSPAKTTISYTGSEDLTGDADCPHPTLFGIGTESKKVVIKYNQFSSQVPAGVLDFEVSYDGTTYENIWDGGSSTTIEYESAQNPWGAGDETFSDFQVFDINDGAQAIDLRLKFRIEPIFDDSGANTVFSGTKWVLAEVLNQGTGFSTGEVYPISFEVRLADNSLVNLTLNIKITEVGNIETTQEGDLQDIIRVGDTLNGHRVLRAFHTFERTYTESGQFPYHIIYVDGTGDDFTKDTAYTSSRDHVVTAVAGYGIKDRAILVGMYEFLQKSLQYVTADINQNAPDVFNSVKKPVAFVSVNENGQITDVNVSGGAYAFDFNTFYRNNSVAALTGYSSEDNVATTGGSGSGLTVDVEVGTLLNSDGDEIQNAITDVKVHSCGSGYAENDEVTISGGSAKIRILEITNGGANLNKLDEAPIIGLTSPADKGTPLSSKSTDDGNIDFVLQTNNDNTIDFEIVTGSDGNPDVEPTSKTLGGNNKQAKIKASLSGGKITSVTITEPGAGYSKENRPEIVVDNLYEETKETYGNDAYNPEFEGNTRTIFNDLPEGDVRLDETDVQNVMGSYNQMPKTRRTVNKEAPLDIKMDPDRERIKQRPQYKVRPSAVDPLYKLEPEYDTTYLANVDIDQEYKQVIADDKSRSQETWKQNLKDITQDVIPEFTKNDESKVETVVGSLTGLPESSEYTKYIMRQYRPDPSKSATIQVTLSCTPENLGHSGYASQCTTPGLTPNFSSSSTDPETGVTTSTSITYTMSGLLGPGCQSWTATGSMKIWHDLTRATNTVGLAARRFGNPFTE